MERVTFAFEMLILESAGISAVSRTFLQTVHSLCFEPLTPIEAALSVIQPLDL